MPGTYRKNIDAKRAALASSGRLTSTEKRKRMQKSDVAMFIVENNIQMELELKSHSVECRDDYMFWMCQSNREALVQE